MSTKTRLAARTIIEQTGRGHTIFNDKLADGRRSLKVWGWSPDEYKLAKALLEQMGCKVELESTCSFNSRGGQWITANRLHVTE